MQKREMRRTSGVVWVALTLLSVSAGCGGEKPQGTGGSGATGSSSDAGSGGTGTGTGTGGGSGGAGGSGSGVGGSGGSGGAGGLGGAGGMGGSGATGGMGGSGAAGGMGGAGGSGGCVVAADCPSPATECEAATCIAGVCGKAPKPAGTPIAAQSAGDCKLATCDGSGGVTTVNDPADAPSDQNECTADACSNGAPSHPPIAAGWPCGAGMSMICNGMGACVGCLSATDCPGQDTACQTRVCSAGMCGFAYAPAGLFVSDPVMGDCKRNECNGSGQIVAAPSPTDLPNDMNSCTGDTCVGGAPSFVPLAQGTVCNQNGGTMCNGAGACVQCVSPSTCPGQDDECKVRSCDAGKCGFSYMPAGTPVAAQTTGDCKKNQCDGAGAIVAAADNADVPVDGNQCTADVCTMGVPSNPPLPIGSACNQNGGLACNGAGTCAVPPTVLSTAPADGATVLATTQISVTFSLPMEMASLTAQTAAGACTGSLQVSLDNFTSCIGIWGSALSAGNTVVTLTPEPGLLVNRNYRIRVTTDAYSASGMPLASSFTTPNGFTTTSPNLCDYSVVISQVFGGGGTAANVPNADYVELHNRGTTAVGLSGWSIQYASGTGSSWANAIVPLSGTIQPGGYFLVRVQSSQATGTALPTPDVLGTNYNFSGSAGKVALVSSTIALTGNCPTGPQIVDLVGYGTQSVNVGCWEGAATAAPGMTGASAAMRIASGCPDVNNNGDDFIMAAPAPRNSATAAQTCACTVHNEANTALEADMCTIQSPLSMTAMAGAATPLVYGRILETGVTEAAGAATNVRAQVGWGSSTANPQYEPWTWVNASFSSQAGTSDEYQASFTAPATGSYRYAYRFSLDNGVSWTVCDRNAAPDFGAGSNAGLTFDLVDLPVLTVP
jgi:hypothetical protein